MSAGVAPRDADAEASRPVIGRPGRAGAAGTSDLRHSVVAASKGVHTSPAGEATAHCPKPWKKQGDAVGENWHAVAGVPSAANEPDEARASLGRPGPIGHTARRHAVEAASAGVQASPGESATPDMKLNQHGEGEGVGDG